MEVEYKKRLNTKLVNNKKIVDLDNNIFIRSECIEYNDKDLKEQLDNKFNYSTEEQVIGKWKNGKNIYQKIISFEIGDNSNLSIDYNISNIDEIWINESGSFITSNLETLSINWYYAENDWCRTWVHKNLQKIRFKSPSSLGIRTCNVCLNYTKTTD